MGSLSNLFLTSQHRVHCVQRTSRAQSAAWVPKLTTLLLHPAQISHVHMPARAHAHVHAYQYDRTCKYIFIRVPSLGF